MRKNRTSQFPCGARGRVWEAVFEGWNLHDVLETYEHGGLAAIDDYYSRGG